LGICKNRLSKLGDFRMQNSLNVLTLGHYLEEKKRALKVPMSYIGHSLVTRIQKRTHCAYLMKPVTLQARLGAWVLEFINQGRHFYI
jgi:hypothetical protein